MPATTVINTKGDIYKYSIEGKILLNNGATIQNIDESAIQYLYIEYDYFNYSMPMIFMSIALDNNIIDNMIQYATNSVINLTIYKYIDNNFPMKVVYIQEQFAYFLGKDRNQNRDMDYAYINEKRTDVYTIVTLGLLKIDHINKNKKRFSGVIKNTTLTNMINYCCEGLPLLLEPLTHDKPIKQMILPPINSVSKAIGYLNNNFQAFYDSPYRFFMDYQTTYLLSCSGKPIPRKGDKINSVAINIKKLDNIGSNMQGMYTDTKNKTYSIDASQFDANILQNNATDKIINSITGIGTSGVLGQTDLKTNKSDYVQTKDTLVRVPNDNYGLIATRKYFLEMNNITLEMSKSDVDSSVFTINNEYSIKATEVYSDRDGKYVLTKKREVYVRDSDHMNLDLILTFKKIPT